MLLRELAKEIFKEKFPPKKVLFRVDAGRVWGLSFGHFSRCCILAKELQGSVNSEITFLMRDYSEGVDYARSFGWTVETLEMTLPKERHDLLVKEWISKIKPDYLVVDLPVDDPNSYLDYARNDHILTVCIDDVSKRSFRADVVLNSSILADRDKYAGCLPTTRFLLGVDYFIMDEYSIKKDCDGHKDRISVLMTFGGSDPSGLTEKTVRALAETPWDNVKFTVILGPGFKEEQNIIDAAKPLRDKMVIVRRPKEIKNFFIRTDLAICAGGATLYELYKIGKPCLAIASIKHEAAVIKRFIEKGLILSGLISWNKERFVSQLRDSLSAVSGQAAAKNAGSI